MGISIGTFGLQSDGELVGSLRRIGEIGPVYEVMSVDGEGLAEIRLVETGRTERYPVSEIRDDPVPA